MFAAATFTQPDIDWAALAPELVLLGAAAITLVVGVFLPLRLRRPFCATVTGLALVAAGIVAGILFGLDDHPSTLIRGSLARDRLAELAQVFVCIAGLLAVGVSYWEARAPRPADVPEHLSDERERIAEYYTLLLAAVAGMAFFVQATTLMSLFLGLEWFSIALYVLTALAVDRLSSLEAGLKYLIVGSFGSAILLFGSAFVYGSTGELRFDAIGDAAPGTDRLFFVAGLAMILVGLAFKVSAAPFHMWTPDVYEGAPTAVMAFMATATKTIALAVLLRVMITSFPMSSDIWEGAVAAVAIASMLIGNIAALRQTNVKRMLAYSGVGQAGYLLIAVVVHTPLATRALLYYIAVYAAMNLGALAVVSVREREIGGPVSLEDLKGLGRDHPLLAGGLALSLLSLASFPPTGGFLAKVYLFGSAIDAGMSYLAVIGVIGTMISLAYYLRFLMAIYTPPGTVKPRPRIVPGTRLAATAVLASAAIVLWLGIAPAPFIDVARTAAASLVPHA